MISGAAIHFALFVAGSPQPGPMLQLDDVPGVAVSYYEVSGREVPEIHKSVAKLAPKDPRNGRPLPATSSWTVAVKLNTQTIGKRCNIIGARVDFRGTATMPRLADDPERPAEVAAAWENYRARLEARQAAQLQFARERMVEVESAILASRCDRAESAADAAIARLVERQRLAFAEDSKNPPKLEEPKR